MSFLKFLKSLKGASRAAASDVDGLLKSVDSGVSSVDDVLREMPVQKLSNGYIKLGDEYLGGVNKILREANLTKLARTANSAVKFSSTDEAAFKQVVGATPERSLRELGESVQNVRRSFAQLDTTLEQIENLSNTAKQDLKTVEGNLLRRFKQGLVISGTLGVVVVAGGWIAKATRDRTGCFMVTRIGDKVTSCKVQSYSCSAPRGGNMCTQTFSHYNVTLSLMHIARLDNSDARKQRVAQIAGVPVAEVESKLGNIIDTHFGDLTTYIESLKAAERPKVDVCSITHPDIERGTVPPCRMCSPSADPMSTEYIDPAQYGDNITFHCSESPSVLETVVDVGRNAGVNLFEGLTSGLGHILRPLLKYGLIVVVVLGLLLLVFKYVMSRRQADQVQVSSVPYQKLA